MNCCTVIAVAIALSIASCSKKKDTISTNNPPGNDTSTIPKASTTPSSAFHPFVDTFKGYVDEASRIYYYNDSAIYFYVYHFKKDSFSVTSNTNFLGTSDGRRFTVNIKLRKNDSGQYHLSHMYYEKVTLIGNSMTFKWAFGDEVAKMPAGGFHTVYLYALAAKTGTSFVR